MVRVLPHIPPYLPRETPNRQLPAFNTALQLLHKASASASDSSTARAWDRPTFSRLMECALDNDDFSDVRQTTTSIEGQRDFLFLLPPLFVYLFVGVSVCRSVGLSVCRCVFALPFQPPLSSVATHVRALCLLFRWSLAGCSGAAQGHRGTNGRARRRDAPHARGTRVGRQLVLISSSFCLKTSQTSISSSTRCPPRHERKPRGEGEGGQT